MSTGRSDNLASVRQHVELVVGDIRDGALVERMTRGADVVFHQAALVAGPATMEAPVLSAEVNDIGTLNVLLAARNAEVRRVVFASSAAVYGDIHPSPHHEDMLPSPGNPYAAHKLLGEHYGRMFGWLYGLEVVSLRYFNVFGPRQDSSSAYSGVISVFMNRLKRGLQILIYGDGGQSRDFIYIDDVVRANILAAHAEGVAGKAYNIGTGRKVTVNQLLEMLNKLTGSTAMPILDPLRAGDIYESRAQVDKARTELGFEADVRFETGLNRTWDWVRSSDGI